MTRLPRPTAYTLAFTCFSRDTTSSHVLKLPAPLHPAVSSRPPAGRAERIRQRWMTALLYLIQPAARLCGRKFILVEKAWHVCRDAKARLDPEMTHTFAAHGASASSRQGPTDRKGILHGRAN